MLERDASDFGHRSSRMLLSTSGSRSDSFISAKPAFARYLQWYLVAVDLTSELGSAESHSHGKVFWTWNCFERDKVNCLLTSLLSRIVTISIPRAYIGPHRTERWDEAIIPQDYNLEGQLTVLLSVPHRRNSHTKGKVCGASQGSHWRATGLSG